MTARRPNTPDIFLTRSEYTWQSRAAMRGAQQRAIDQLEDLLQAETPAAERQLSYRYEDGITTRRLELAYSEPEQEGDSVLFFDGETAAEYSPRPILSELAITMTYFDEGMLEETAVVSLEQHVEGATHPLIARYGFETYRGGVVHSTVGRTDVIAGQGLDERPMAPYDFEELEGQLALVASLRGELIGSDDIA